MKAYTYEKQQLYARAMYQQVSTREPSNDSTNWSTTAASGGWRVRAAAAISAAVVPGTKEREEADD